MIPQPKNQTSVYKTKEFHWVLTHGQRDKIWLPKHGLIDTKRFGTFVCYSEMRYPENYPDEIGGGTIMPCKLTTKFIEDLGFLPKIDSEF